MKRKSASKRRQKKPVNTALPRAPSPQASVSFPIVGVGASAGGLEALELFLRQVPKGSGIAFVIVQHLDPTHKGILCELLQGIKSPGGGADADDGERNARLRVWRCLLNSLGGFFPPVFRRRFPFHDPVSCARLIMPSRVPDE